MKAGKAKAKESDKNVSFSVEKIWRSYRQKDDTCTWKEGIQKTYDGCKKAVSGFAGPSHDISYRIVTSFETYISKLIQFTYCDSLVLNSSANAILESLSKCNKLGGSGLTMLIEFEEVMLGLPRELNKIVTKLSPIIGDDLTCTVANSFNDLSDTFSKFLKEFLKGRIARRKNKSDYEAVLKKLQKLMNITARMAEKVLNACEQEIHEAEAVTVLIFIEVYYILVIQGVNSCVQEVSFNEECSISQTFEAISEPLDTVIVAIIQSIESVVPPFAKSIKTLLANFINITVFVNSSWQDIFAKYLFNNLFHKLTTFLKL